MTGPRLVWDIETDGLLPELTRIHCIVAIDIDTAQEHIFRPDQIEDGLKLLSSASLLAGHNIISFDLPAIVKLYPEWTHQAAIVDTMLMTRLHRPDLSEVDAKLIHFGKLPPHLRGRHSLEAWGYRIGKLKSDFGKTSDWATFSEEMLTYCIQDVRVNVALWRFLECQRLSEMAVRIENDLGVIITAQESYGFWFDKDAALKLQAELMNREAELKARLREVFAPWYVPGRTQTVKTTRHVKMPQYPDITIPRLSPKTGKPLKPYVGPPLCTYEAGSQYVPFKLTEFNPASREHVADRLQKLFGWQPREFTPEGHAVIDETTLKGLDPKIVPADVRDALLEYFVVSKTLGMLGHGSQSWLRSIDAATGRVHCRLTTNGAVTGRATHRNPNLAQVPRVQSVGKQGDGTYRVLKGYEGGWGYECRSLFGAEPGWVLVGCDASGLELRMLAHYLHPFDGGAYVDVVTRGDPHTHHQTLAGLASRDIAKTWIYAFIYGAGDWKLGHTARQDLTDSAKKALGGKLRATFLKNFPALKALSEAVQTRVKERGFLTGLDGRRIYVRKSHAALNALLQGAGAVVCKAWIIEFHRRMRELGYVHGADYRQVAWVHDEIQVECRPGLEATIGAEAKASIARAGEILGVRCPLTGDFKHGTTWASTH